MDGGVGRAETSTASYSSKPSLLITYTLLAPAALLWPAVPARSVLLRSHVGCSCAVRPFAPQVLAKQCLTLNILYLGKRYALLVSISRLTLDVIALLCFLVVAADGLSKREVFRLPDPFAVITVDAEQTHTTSVIKKTLNPYWNESFDMYVS